MSMFNNYDNQNPCVIPNNINNEPAYEYKTVDHSVPKKMFDAHNNFIGYCWSYGDTFTLKINLNDTVRVHKDSIILTEDGKYPTTYTRGYEGQQAYNIVNSMSWTCVGLIDGIYVWVPDLSLVYDANGTKELEFPRDLSSATIEVNIFNFRWEPIKTLSYSNCNEISIDINKELSMELKNGLYHCTINVNNIEEQKFLLSVI